MTTFTRNTVRTAVLTALCVFGSVTAMAQQAPGVPESASAKISLTGLDLSTPEGITAARERVHQAARRLCSAVAHSTDIAHQPDFIKCVDVTMASALPQLSGAERVAAAGATATIAAKAAAPVGFPQASSGVLSFADLDLSTPEGARTAHERLHQAARKLCSQIADELDLAHHADYLACIDGAMTQALPKVEALVRQNAPTPALAQGFSR
jgi:UrcA family protein